MVKSKRNSNQSSTFLSSNVESVVKKRKLLFCCCCLSLCCPLRLSVTDRDISLHITEMWESQKKSYFIRSRTSSMTIFNKISPRASVKKASKAQCYRMYNLRHFKRGNIFGNFNDFKQSSAFKKSPFWPLLFEK